LQVRAAFADVWLAWSLPIDQSLAAASQWSKAGVQFAAAREREAQPFGLASRLGFGTTPSYMVAHMAIPHATSGQLINVQPLGAGLPSGRTTALFKSEQLEVIRLVLPAGKSLPPHSVPGEITVQCIEGHIDVTAEGRSHLLQAGQMLYLSRAVSHGVVALQDSSALVTIVLAK
jgi:quercetin dioxygenase-like cupin family protein